MKNILLLLTAATVLSACVRYKFPRDIEAEGSGLTKVIGIETILHEMNSDDELNIFMIHGMGTHGPNDYDPSVENYANLLGLEYVSSFVFKLESSVYKNTRSPNLKLYFYNKDNKKVRFTYIHWSPLTTDYKNFIKSNDFYPKRSTINTKLKKSLVNDGFGDVTALADSRRQEQLGFLFDQAIQLQFVDRNQFISGNDSLELDSEIELRNNIIISSSLGSKLVFEYLQKFYGLAIADREGTDQNLAKWNNQESVSLKNYCDQSTCTLANPDDVQVRKTISESVYNSTVHWYQLSNQLVLLRGLDFDFNHKPTDASAIKAYEKANELSRKRFQDNITVTAFYERNDLLGYAVPDSLEGHAFTPVNIYVPQVKKSFLNIYSNADKAHRGARTDEYVSYILTKGWDGNHKSLPKRLKIKSMMK